MFPFDKLDYLFPQITLVILEIVKVEGTFWVLRSLSAYIRWSCFYQFY